MTATFLALVLSFAAALAVEALPAGLAPLKAALTRPPAILALRAALHVALFAAAFALSWRPWHAALVSVVVTGLFALGSEIKRRILGEPLIFTDFALVRQALKHPKLYYADRLAEPRALAAFAVLAVATVLWFALEPSRLDAADWPLVLLPPFVVVATFAVLLSPPAERFAQAAVGPAPDAALDAARFGLPAALALHWLAWRGASRPGPAAQAAAAAVPAPRPAAEGARIIVAIQCESFVDIAARGLDGPPLPAFAALKREAIAWGRCRVPAEGAYTMRSEFGFLTGLPSRALGLDAFDPYLAADAYAARTLPKLFARSGRRTAFLHPYDRRFFDRETIVPALGFERFVDGRAFEGARRVGPYVSDEAVADAVLAEIAALREPSFLFVVTIENHGPWGPGRLAETDDPAAQYALHLANADRMIGRIAAALSEVPGGAILCLYGDHAPARTLHPGLPDRRATDYLLWDTRRRLRPAPTARLDLDVDALGRALLANA